MKKRLIFGTCLSRSGGSLASNMLTCHKGNCNFVSNSVALAKHRARCSKDKDSELPIIVNVESGRELACEFCDHVAFTKHSLKDHLKVMINIEGVRNE